jgi:hypothetical protein
LEGDSNALLSIPQLTNISDVREYTISFEIGVCRQHN